MKTLLRDVIVIGAWVAPLVVSSSCASPRGTGSETHFVCESDHACIAAARGNRCVDHVCRTVTERGDASIDSSSGSGGVGPGPSRESSVETGGAESGGAGGTSAGGANAGGEHGDAKPPGQGGTASDGGPDASCGDTRRDPANCGRCGNVCPGTNATCDNGRCGLCSGCGNRNAIAVDATSVYWSTTDSFGGGKLMKMPIVGGTPTELALDHYGYGIAVDATSAYYFSAAGSRGMLMKVPLVGGASVLLATGFINPSAIAIDATSAYWVNAPSNAPANGTVMKVPLTGGTPVTLASGVIPRSVAADGSSVYWTDGGGTVEADGGIVVIDGKVMKVPLAGGTPITLAVAPTGDGIAVDATNVYWTGGDKVMKVPLAGGTPVTLASGQEDPTAIVVDGTNAYFTVKGPVDPIDGPLDGKVMKVPLAGGTPTTLASGQRWLWAIAVDATNVYWTDPVTDTVKHAHK